jgi:hypothetical protein
MSASNFICPLAFVSQWNIIEILEHPLLVSADQNDAQLKGSDVYHEGKRSEMYVEKRRVYTACSLGSPLGKSVQSDSENCKAASVL